MTSASLPPLRILVIDDNEASAKTLGWMMELLGHDIRLAHNGVQGIDTARKFLPHIVLLDIGLPGMNGYEACMAMRKEPALAKTVFIAQTGWGQSEYLERSKEAGFDHHLVKPVDMRRLQALVTSLHEAQAAQTQG